MAFSPKYSLSAVFLCFIASACGAEGGGPSGSPGPDAGPSPVVVGGVDSAVPLVQDAGVDAGPTCQLGASCTLPGGAAGYQNCFPSPSCIDRNTVSNFLDAGIQGLLEGGIGQVLAEAGLNIGIGEGGITLGDASIQLEAGTLKCPTGFMCSSIGAAAGLPISACADPSMAVFGITLPPTCAAPGPCMVGGSPGTCQNIVVGMYCVVPCN